MTTGHMHVTLARGYHDYEGKGMGAMRKVLLGFKRRMIPIPWFLFTRILQREAKKTKRVLGGLDNAQRRVHRFVV
ncbi:MAG: hypothetical protein PVI82_15385 [Desulfobacterales bacterium]